MARNISHGPTLRKRSYGCPCTIINKKTPLSARRGFLQNDVLCCNTVLILMMKGGICLQANQQARKQTHPNYTIKKTPLMQGLGIWRKV